MCSEPRSASALAWEDTSHGKANVPAVDRTRDADQAKTRRTSPCILLSPLDKTNAYRLGPSIVSALLFPLHYRRTQFRRFRSRTESLRINSIYIVKMRWSAFKKCSASKRFEYRSRHRSTLLSSFLVYSVSLLLLVSRLSSPYAAIITVVYVRNPNIPSRIFGYLIAAQAAGERKANNNHPRSRTNTQRRLPKRSTQRQVHPA